MDSTIFKNKTVLITGHTGFKGSWLTVIYKGPVDVDLVLQDQSKMGLGPQVALLESSPFKGIWMGKEFKKDPISVASAYRRSGYINDSRDYYVIASFTNYKR